MHSDVIFKAVSQYAKRTHNLTYNINIIYSTWCEQINRKDIFGDDLKIFVSGRPPESHFWGSHTLISGCPPSLRSCDKNRSLNVKNVHSFVIYWHFLCNLTTFKSWGDIMNGVSLSRGAHIWMAVTKTGQTFLSIICELTVITGPTAQSAREYITWIKLL